MKIRPRTNPYHNFVRTTFAASQFTDPEHIVRDDFNHCTLGIAGETLEWAEARLDYLFCEDNREATRTAYIKELGDLCYYVAMLENTMDKYVATAPKENLAVPDDVEYKLLYTGPMQESKLLRPINNLVYDPNEVTLIPPQELFGRDENEIIDLLTKQGPANHPYTLIFERALNEKHGDYLSAESLDKRMQLAVMEIAVVMLCNEYIELLPTYKNYETIDFPQYVEGFLDYVKRVLYYRTADWALLPIYIRGFWAFITVFATVDLDLTLQDILNANESKLRKRYPTGTFTPEDATRKADNNA
jgi:NTP pyrophosphatase (non-canonical NTP hydrolase)